MSTDSLLMQRAFTSKEVGQAFLGYYREHDYEIVPGSSLLDPSVPMSFVMSAGLAQVESSVAQHGSKMVIIMPCYKIVSAILTLIPLETAPSTSRFSRWREPLLSSWSINKPARHKFGIC